MKFNIHRPPDIKGGREGNMSELVLWLYVLSERLNVVLSNLSEENFSPSAREKLFKGKEENNDNI